jgi:hypothetical protein
MGAKRDHGEKRKTKRDVPSTGRGAASAMDALIRRRIPAAGSGNAPQPDRSKKH